MKETLDENTRKDLIEYRLARAAETIAEACYIADGDYFNAAVNRLYYACPRWRWWIGTSTSERR